MLVYAGLYFYSVTKDRGGNQPPQGAPKAPILIPPQKFTNLEDYFAAVKRGTLAEFWTGSGTASTQAVVDLSLSESGTIVELKIAKSSGIPRYDEAALQAIRRAEPYPILVSSGAKPTLLRLTFNGTYRLGNNRGDTSPVEAMTPNLRVEMPQ